MRLDPAHTPAIQPVGDREWIALRAAIEASLGRLITLTGATPMATERDRRAVARRLDAVEAKLAAP